MSDFQRVRYGYRFVDTLYGDTLQTIAARELGDASRWTDLVAYNDLVPPFITDDPTLAVDGVLLTGRPILIPAPSPVISATADPNAVFGSDIQLSKRGELLTDGKDFLVASGADNLVQALGCRVRTALRELIFHPDYGCDLRRLIGKVNGPTKSLLAAQIVKAAVSQDPRVNKVKSSTANVAGEEVDVDVIAETIAGRSVTASLST